MPNTLLLASELLVYFGVMAALFRARQRFGLGLFFCALGSMHFLETYLAGILYVELPLGIVVSPGSTVLFAGKLMMLLLLYIREDASAVRQPIYGLLIGNLLTIALVSVMRLHAVVPAAPGRLPDFGFMDEMGWLMVWGTVLLFADSLLIILLYERLGRRLRTPVVRVWLSAAAVLTFDQVGFWLALHWITGASATVLVSGWIAKMTTAAAYAALVGAYLAWCERPDVRTTRRRRLSDLFDVLTYRERYEALLERSGRDSLTGAFDRGRLDSEGHALVERCTARGEPVSLLAIDIDHFKTVNDRFGHSVGDAVLRELAARLKETCATSASVYRYGGEEFVVLCCGQTHAEAMAMAERVRADIADEAFADVATRITISIGVATSPEHGSGLLELFIAADERLYAAKDGGRDRVNGDPRRRSRPGAGATAALQALSASEPKRRAS